MRNLDKDRAIIQFMGGKAISDDTLNPLIKKWDSPKFPLAHGKFICQNELKFRTDWNWLMPVVIELCLNITGITSMDTITDLCFNTIINEKKKR
jgi:hypothetical protein